MSYTRKSTKRTRPEPKQKPNVKLMSVLQQIREKAQDDGRTKKEESISRELMSYLVLMTLTMSTILSMCEKNGSKAEVSYYEVYMDRCWDLLVKADEIAIWDDKDGQLPLKGLSSVAVNSRKAARSRHISNNVSLNPKVKTPMVKIDMASKLQAWLESKGKTKSTHRMMAIRSPLIGTNQTSISQSSVSVKKFSCHKSTITQSTKLAGTGQRNLFGEETPAASHLWGETT